MLIKINNQLFTCYFPSYNYFFTHSLLSDIALYTDIHLSFVDTCVMFGYVTVIAVYLQFVCVYVCVCLSIQVSIINNK